MDWQGALRARLIAAAPVTALVVQRVYWVDRPQASDLPAITLQTISEERPQHMKGFDGLDVSRVQLDCWATSYSQAQALKEAALAATVGEHTGNGVRFERAFIDSIRDLGERVETQFIHRASIDLIIHHSTA
jgi:hypothetical protein